MCECLKTNHPLFIYSFLQQHVNRYLLSTLLCARYCSGTYYEMINEIGIAPRIRGIDHQPQIYKQDQSG